VLQEPDKVLVRLLSIIYERSRELGILEKIRLSGDIALYSYLVE